MKIKYILDWKKKEITNNGGFHPIYLNKWEELNKLNLTVYCSAEDFVWIKIEKNYPAELSEIIVGQSIIRSLPRGADSENPEGWGTRALKKCWEFCPNFVNEHPSHNKELFKEIGGWRYPPRFENLKEGIFKNVWKIDIKNCFANIMREYPLPFGEAQHLTDPKLIKQKIQEGKTGFVRFLLKSPAKIKNNQIPFIPNYHNEIKEEVKGRLLLHTRLFHTFQKQYKTFSKPLYTDFWIFPEQKGSIDPFLNYCEQLKEKEETKKEGKMLVNAFSGAVGKETFRGYNYRAWGVAISHLAILQTYYLYRQFKSEQVLAIRSDCIYIQGELPVNFHKELYHLEHFNLIGFQGKDNLYIYDNQELKSFVNDQAREELIEHFLQQKDK